MWPILKAEIQYNAILFFIYLTLTIGFTFVERAMDDGGRFYVAIILFLIVQNWLSLKGKEKRDIFIALLPKSQMIIGGVRIAMIVASAIIIILVYKGMHMALDIQGHANYPVTAWKLLSYVSILLFFFSLYFIITDVLTPHLRELYNFDLIKERLLQAFLLLAVVLQILGVVALMTRAPNIVTKVFDLIYHNNPFDNIRNIQFSVVVSLVIAGLSTYTYSKRKNYVQ